MSRVLPILFNTEMVRAILDDRKTTTRRLIMPHNRKKAKEQGCRQGSGLWVDLSADNLDREGHIKDYSISDCWMRTSIYIQKYAPYRPGDILYVRETFRPLGDHPDAWVEYAADWSPEYFENSREKNACNGGKWKPSIHMPKGKARIWLRVTDVRVERLCDITEEQAVKEGLYKGWHQTKTSSWASTAKQAFMWVWNMTVKKGEYIFAANPWVWVIEFELCEKPEEDKHEHRISESIKSETATI